MGRFAVGVLGHAVTRRAVNRYARKHGKSRVSRGWDLFKDASVSPGSKLLALAIGVAITWLLMLLQVPVEIVIGLIIPFFFDEAAMLLANGLELILLPMLIANLVLPSLVVRPATTLQTVPPALGEIIDMPPPMLG